MSANANLLAQTRAVIELGMSPRREVIVLLAELADALEAAESTAASAESMMEAYRTEAHAMTALAEAAEAQRDTLYCAASALWKSDKIDETANEHWLALRDALAVVAPPEEQP